MWGRHHHRRHIVHGVGLPQRLLERGTSEDDWTMLRKLIEWSVDWDWAGQACVRVKKKVMEAQKLVLRNTIDLDNHSKVCLLNLFQLASWVAMEKPCIPVTTAILCRAVVGEMSRDIMRWLVANFDFSSVKSKSMDRNYKTALRLAKKIENSSEGWIYDALKARSGEPSSQEKARRMAEDRSSQEIVNKWVSTDVVAYMSTRDGSTIGGVGIVGQLRDKRGRWFHRPPIRIYRAITGIRQANGF
jgi:hypothetical protein